jgi:hypothetical protein
MLTSKKFLGALTIAGLLSTGTIAFAQTSTSTTTGTTGATTTTGTTDSTTPGTPNTGAGGDTATNLALLGASALIAAGGAAYLARKRSLA